MYSRCQLLSEDLGTFSDGELISMKTFQVYIRVWSFRLRTYEEIYLVEEKNKCLNSSVSFRNRSLVPCDLAWKGLQFKVPVLYSFETFRLILWYFLTFKHANVIPNSLLRMRASYIALFHAVHPLTSPITSSLPPAYPHLPHTLLSALS